MLAILPCSLGAWAGPAMRFRGFFAKRSRTGGGGSETRGGAPLATAHRAPASVFLCVRLAARARHPG